MTKSGAQDSCRRIIAEDPDWSLALVPTLSQLCLQNIVSNFEENPIYEELPPSQKVRMEELLSPSLPLRVTANLLSDGVYWRRCCEQRWDICDISHYGNSWKRMFFEKHLENIIELFIPTVTDPNTVLDMIPLCKDYVKRLEITQLLPPIKEPQRDDDHDPDLSSDTDYDPPAIDHFDFSILLHQLSSLEELQLVYRVKQCGMHFEWTMFEMTDTDCLTLAKVLRTCTTLKILRLHESHIKDNHCRVLVKHLLDHPSLKELSFAHNLIGDRGATAIGKLLGKSKLEVLNLCDNNIQSMGAKAIGHALAKNSTLVSLNLRLNRLGNRGGRAICKALLKNKTLLHLHLGASGVTEHTAFVLSEVLLQNETLKSLNLSCNSLGVDGGKSLQEAVSHNTHITQCDVHLTDIEESSTALINQVVWTNQSSEQRKQAQDVVVK